MKPIIAFLCTLFFQESVQWCRPKGGITTCGNEVLSSTKPLNIEGYKYYLEFEQGTLNQIPPGSLQHLPDLTTLQISRNNIKIFKEGAFDGLRKLKTLTAFENKLYSIEPGTFRECSSLQSLSLRKNDLPEIGYNSFQGLTSLRDLDLGFNKLKIVPEAVNSLHSLRSLDLSYNNLKTITANSFSNLHSLTDLKISDNEIRAIERGAFNGLSKLSNLDLSVNLLSDLNVANIKNEIGNLKTIKISVNQFTCKILSMIVEELESKGVTVIRGFSKSSVTVIGIGCKVDK